VFTPTVLGPKEAEMRIIGCDLHGRQRTVAMLDTLSGEVVSRTFTQKANERIRPVSKVPLAPQPVTLKCSHTA
jgi:hypothetical protein